MREPGIHISKSTFIYLLDKYHINLTKSQVDSFFKSAREYAIPHRGFIVNPSQAKKVKSRTSSPLKDANMLANTLYMVRVKLKHFGISKVKQGDPEWVEIGSLVPIVNEFCKIHQLTKKEGYIAYIETGFEILGSNKKDRMAHCVSWLKNKASWINSRYEVKQEIAKDDSPEETKVIYDIYISQIYEKTGMISVNYSEPKDYVHFIRARKLADEIGIEYSDFIQAQFEALEFCNGIPNPEDLYGDKGYNRLVKYMSKHNYTVKPGKSKLNQSIWDEFKK